MGDTLHGGAMGGMLRLVIIPGDIIPTAPGIAMVILPLHPRIATALMVIMALAGTEGMEDMAGALLLMLHLQPEVDPITMPTLLAAGGEAGERAEAMCYFILFS